MSERIDVALASRSATRLWLALVALTQTAKLKVRPRQEGPHVFLGKLRLTRVEGHWRAAQEVDEEEYDRCPYDARMALMTMLSTSL